MNVHHRLRCVLCLAAIFVSVVPVQADEPTIAELTEGVPVLKTTDTDLKAFSFTFSMSIPYGAPWDTDVVWKKDGPRGVLQTLGEKRVPMYFVSGNQSLSFDVCSGTILMSDNSYPVVQLKFPGKKFEFANGMGSKDKSGINMDLRSLFDRTEVKRGTVSRNKEGQLVVSSQVSQRGNQAIAVFDGQKPHRIRSIKLISAEKKEQPFVQVSDIRMNEEVNTNWPTIPDLDKFPTGLDVVETWRPVEGNAEKMKQLIDWAAINANLQLGHAAVQNKVFRDYSLNRNVDWAAAEKHKDQFLKLLPLLTPSDTPKTENGTSANELPNTDPT